MTTFFQLWQELMFDSALTFACFILVALLVCGPYYIIYTINHRKK